MLNFCHVCKKLLIIEKRGEVNVGACVCGFKRTSGIEISCNEENNDFKTLGVVYEIFSSKEMVENICDKCGFNRSEVSEIAANESNIFIFKCLKCGFTKRQSQGSSKF